MVCLDWCTVSSILCVYSPACVLSLLKFAIFWEEKRRRHILITQRTGRWFRTDCSLFGDIEGSLLHSSGHWVLQKNSKIGMPHTVLHWQQISKNILGNAFSNMLKHFCENRLKFKKKPKKWSSERWYLFSWNRSDLVYKIKNLFLFQKCNCALT